MRYPVFQAARFARSPATIFRDDFNRANGNMTANPNWSLLAGVATAITVASNALATVDTDSNDLVACPNLGLPAINQYVQAEYRTNATNRGWLVFKIGTVPALRYIRMRKATNYEIAVASSAGVNVRVNTAGTLTAGDILRLEYRDGVVDLKKNGTSIITPYTLDATELADLKFNTGAGVLTSSAAASPFLDNFEYGILA